MSWPVAAEVRPWTASSAGAHLVTRSLWLCPSILCAQHRYGRPRAQQPQLRYVRPKSAPCRAPAQLPPPLSAGGAAFGRWPADAHRRRATSALVVRQVSKRPSRVTVLRPGRRSGVPIVEPASRQRGRRARHEASPPAAAGVSRRGGAYSHAARTLHFSFVFMPAQSG